MEIVHHKLPDEKAKEVTEAAEQGRGGVVKDAVSGMSFQDTYSAFKQIEKLNSDRLKTDSSLPKLSVDLALDNSARSESVTLRRACDAFGPKGESLYSYTHNFDGIDVSSWSPLSILCPPKN